MITLQPGVSLVDKDGFASDAFFTWISDVQRQLNKRPVTVAALPSVKAGTRAFVTDSTSTTFHAVVAGTGSNLVPVYYDGTNWRIG